VGKERPGGSNACGLDGLRGTLRVGYADIKLWRVLGAATTNDGA
jgi:hypothetical protein